MKNYYKKFIGSQKILKIELSNDLTWSGKPMWKVSFYDGRIQTYPEQVIKQIAIKKKTDATELQKLRCQSIIKEVIKALVDYDSIKPYPTAEKILEIFAEEDLNITDDIKYVMESVNQAVQNTFSGVTNAVNKSIAEANRILWDMESYDKTMMSVHKIIKDNQITKK